MHKKRRSILAVIHYPEDESGSIEDSNAIGEVRDAARAFVNGLKDIGMMHWKKSTPLLARPP